MRCSSLGSSFSCAVILALTFVVPTPSQAAEITQISSAFDEDNPFDVKLDVGFRRTQKRSKITQEYYDSDAGAVIDTLALRYTEISYEMPLNLKIGLYRDLELRAGTSIVFSNHRQWRLPVYKDSDRDEKFDDSGSTILSLNDIDANGESFGLNEDGTSLTAPIFEPDGESFRSGLGNVLVGLRWAAFNERRDWTKPTWILGFDWTIPSSPIAKPSKVATSDNPGDIGDGVHRFTFSTAFSKQFGVLDPYLSLWYSLPVGSGGRYSNCEHPELLSEVARENCSVSDWSKDEVALKPQHIGGLMVGTEIVPWENRAEDRRFSIDLRLGATYYSKGRIYNELSDALQKLLWTEDYVALGGTLGLNYQPVRYVSLRADVGFYHETAHYLTGESTGKDLTGICDDESDPDKRNQACVSMSNIAHEVNPNFDYRYDTVGRRFRVNETSIFTFSFTGAIQF